MIFQDMDDLRRLVRARFSARSHWILLPVDLRGHQFLERVEGACFHPLSPAAAGFDEVVFPLDGRLAAVAFADRRYMSVESCSRLLGADVSVLTRQSGIMILAAGSRPPEKVVVYGRKVLAAIGLALPKPIIVGVN